MIPVVGLSISAHHPDFRAGKFTDELNRVTEEKLQSAADARRRGEISTEVLRRVAEAWRKQKPI